MLHKEEFNNPFKNIIIFILLFLVSSVFYIYFNYQGIVFENKEIQNTLLAQNKEISLLKEEIDFLRFESDGKVDEIKKKLEQEELLRKAVNLKRETQDQIAQQKISNLEEQISLANTLPAMSSIIKEWQPIVVYVECDFQLSNSGIHYETTGSGVVIKFDDLPVKVITNRHVLTGPAFYNLDSCKVKFPETNSEFLVSIDDIAFSISEYDWGTLDINNPDDNLNKITSTFPKLCDQKPVLGDEMVVLGYPGIGSKNGTTATEGIISGFDGSYFITSAKVDQGNSGGVAIIQKESCLLGIPTYASLGQVESLARILDIWTIVINKP